MRLPVPRRSWPYLFAVVAVAGCRTTQPGSSPCTPGAQEDCTCDDGSTGRATCASDGTQWGICSCGAVWADPCNGTCTADQVCMDDVSGAYCLGAADCVDPYDICSYADGAGGCVDLSSNVYNCGACGAYCDGNCVLAQCEAPGYPCEDVGLISCTGYCANPESDTDCGTCGNACDLQNGEVCARGACEVGTCEDLGLTSCDTGCADTNTDTNNCGTCGTVCMLGCDGAGSCN